MTTPINSDSSSAAVSNTVNGLNREIQGMQTTQVFKDDTGTRRVLLGNGPDSFSGIRVSKPGIDVYTATNPELLLNSDNPSVFNAVDSDVVSTPALSIASPGAAYDYDVATNTIAHGLSYIPAVFAFLNIGGSYVPIPYTGYVSSGAGASWITYSVQTDGTNVYIITEALTFNRAVSETEIPVKYFLLQESAN